MCADAAHVCSRKGIGMCCARALLAAGNLQGAQRK
jgi:hypothetical protein